jgi:hypothetical protein
MARAVISETLAAACRRFAALKGEFPPATSVSGAVRAALTHALHCAICGPITDDLRRMHTARTARLAVEAQTEAEREAVPVLDQAANVLEANGFHRHFLWDTRQHAAGIPLEFCRVDIVGALAIVLHGSPTYAGTPAVRKVEGLLVDRVAAPSLAAWYSHPGIGGRQAIALVRDTADELRGLSTPQRRAA